MINPIDREGDGEWSAVKPLGIIPMHAIVLPDGKVFSFGNDGSAGARYVYSVFDPKTGVEQILRNTTSVDIFCSNLSIDPNTGNVIIMGGDARMYNPNASEAGIQDVVVFDYKTLTIRDAEQGDMNHARWYGTTVTMANGEIVVLGGHDAGNRGSSIPEVWNTQTGIREIPGAEITDIRGGGAGWWYPYAWANSKGELIVIEGGSRDIYRMTTEGQGTIQKIGATPFGHFQENPAIMFDVDKIAMLGDDGSIWVADIGAATPSFTRVAQLDGARGSGGMSILPDGRIAITGGSRVANDTRNLNSANYDTVIWDPETNTLESQADGALARLYHSSYMLLPNGTLWVGGGGNPGPVNNYNVEFYAPNYLYRADGTLADRPDILDAPKNIDSGQTFRITVDDARAIAEVTGVKVGSSTHSRNSDARFLEFDFTVIDANTIEITTPKANVMIPGLWMLHTIDKAGVPSEASLLGVDMAPITGTGGLDDSPTVIYNIDDEQIDGAFALAVDARFDDLSLSDQTIFDLGNRGYGDKIYLAQIDDTDDLEFVIVQDGKTYRIVAQNAIVEGEVATWRVGIDPDGTMRLAKNDIVLVEGKGVVPADIERGDYKIGEGGISSEPLDGMVRNLKIANYGDLAQMDPSNPDSPCATTGEAACLCNKLVPNLIDTPGNDAPQFRAEHSVTAYTITEMADGVEGENAHTFEAGGNLVFVDADVRDTHTAVFSPNGANYLGKFEILAPSSTSETVIGSVRWNFSVDDRALDFLDEGDTLEQTYTVTVSDGEKTTTQEVTITLRGRADEAVRDLAPAMQLQNAAVLIDDDTIRLTADQASQSGQATTARRIDTSKDFQIRSDIYLGTKDEGADGLAFVLHNDPKGPNAFGGSHGATLGVQGIQKGLALVVDTYASGGDQFYFMNSANGAMIGPSFNLGNVEDGAWHALAVTYSKAAGTMTVSIDDRVVGTLNAGALAPYFAGGGAFMTVSAATGGLSNEHKIRATTFEGSYVGEVEGAPAPDLGLPRLTLAAPADIVEGNETQSRTLAFVATLDKAASVDITASVTISGGASGPATITIPAGQTRVTIPVTVKGDNIREADETITVSLSNAANVIGSNASASVKVLDDDTHVANGSFESDKIGERAWTTTAPEGWTLTGNRDAGVQRLVRQQTETPASEGVNQAYANAGSGLSQVTDLVLSNDGIYTLSVDVGNRADVPGVAESAVIALYAGGVLLAQQRGTDAPRGGFKTETITVDGRLHAGTDLIGQPIEIRLSAAPGSRQANFDSVDLSVRTVRVEPEPQPGHEPEPQPEPPTNAAPLANDDSLWFSLAADEKVTGETAFMLFNDTDPDGDPIQVVSIDALSARGAKVTLRDTNNDGSFESVDYDPTVSSELVSLRRGTQIEDSVSYTISDGKGGTATGRVVLTVDGTAEPATAFVDPLAQAEARTFDFGAEPGPDQGDGGVGAFDLGDMTDQAAA